MMPRSSRRLLPEILIGTRRWLLLSSKRSRPPWTLYHHIRASRTFCVDAADADASLVAHASSRAMRVICARRSTRHFRAGDTERALVCAEACLSGEDAFRSHGSYRGAGALLCVARGDAQGAAGFLDDLASQCASRLAACTVWAPAVAAYLTTSKDAATARHTCSALSNGSADDCLTAALRVLSKEESVPFCLARLEADKATPLTVLEVCFADATEAAGRGRRM